MLFKGNYESLLFCSLSLNDTMVGKICFSSSPSTQNSRLTSLLLERPCHQSIYNALLWTVCLKYPSKKSCLQDTWSQTNREKSFLNVSIDAIQQNIIYKKEKMTLTWIALSVDLMVKHPSLILELHEKECAKCIRCSVSSNLLLLHKDALLSLFYVYISIHLFIIVAKSRSQKQKSEIK